MREFKEQNNNEDTVLNHLDEYAKTVKLVKALFGIDIKLNNLSNPYVGGISFPIGLN